MNVILYEVRSPGTRKGPGSVETYVLEDDGTPDGRRVATFRDWDMAKAVAAAMGWKLVEESRAEEPR